jgi:hypothetical protein
MGNTFDVVALGEGMVEFNQTTAGQPAYPRQQSDAQRYTDEFSRALGLRPTPTLFGNKVVKI